MQWSIHGILVLGLSLLLLGCDQKETPEPMVLAPVVPSAPNAEPLVNYWLARAHQCYDRAIMGVQELDAQVEEFLNEPSDVLLGALKERWTSAHLRFSACHLYHSQGFNQEGHKRLAAQLEQVNAWPIQGGFIDYLPGYEHTGIVNDVTVAITLESLSQQHQISDLADVALGFHAVEFLIWGEQGRPASDFKAQAPQTTEQGIELNTNNRRRVYLQLATRQLVERISQLQNRWQPAAENAPMSAQQQLQQLPSGAQTAYLFSASHRLIDYFLVGRVLNPIQSGNLDDGNESPYSQNNKDALLATFDELGQWLQGSTEVEQQQNLLTYVGNLNDEAAQHWLADYQLALAALDRLPAEFPQQNPAVDEAVISLSNLTAKISETLTAKKLPLLSY